MSKSPALRINVLHDKSVFAETIVRTESAARLHLKEIDAALDLIDKQLDTRRYSSEEWNSIDEYRAWRLRAELARESYAFEHAYVAWELEEAAERERIRLLGYNNNLEPWIVRVIDRLRGKLDAHSSNIRTTCQECVRELHLIEPEMARSRKLLLAHLELSLSHVVEAINTECTRLQIPRDVRKRICEESTRLTTEIRSGISAIDKILTRYTMLNKSQAKILKDEIERLHAKNRSRPSGDVALLLQKL